MTVIAWDGKTLASDSQVTAGHWRVAQFNKLFTLKTGAIMGIAGDGDETNILAVFNQSEDTPTQEDLCNLKGDIDALYISPEKEVYHLNVTGKGEERSAQFYRILDKKSACGSGHIVARVAMEYGATAEDACKMACKFDVNCSEPIYTLKIKKIKEVESDG